MSKAQTDVVAALRIELDATKAALAKSEGARSALAAELERFIRAGRCRACRGDHPETECPVLLVQADLERELSEARAQILRDAQLGVINRRERDEARADVAAHSAPCSECQCQMRVCMDCAEAALAALRVERDSLTKQVGALTDEREGYKKTAARIWSLREYALEHNGPSEMECGHPDNLLDRSVESGTVFCAGCRNAEMLRDALHMEQTHKAEHDSLRERLGDAEAAMNVLRHFKSTGPLALVDAVDNALATFDARKR